VSLEDEVLAVETCFGV